MGILQSDKTRLEEQSEREPRRGGNTGDLLDSTSETSRNLLGSIREARDQYDHELADLWYECDSLQTGLATFDSRSEKPWECLSVACVRLEAYWSAFVSLHLGLESDLASGLGEASMGHTIFL